MFPILNRQCRSPNLEEFKNFGNHTPQFNPYFIYFTRFLKSDKNSSYSFFIFYCMKTLILAFSSLFILLFAACSNDVQTPTLSTNKPYFLKEWPDSAYIKNIDSIIAAEPVKKQLQEKKTNIVLNASTPTLKLPTQKKSETKLTEKTQTTKPQQKQSFAESFANAISKWQSDPNNATLYTTIQAKESEDILQLLARTYGKEAKKLPRFYTLSVLQSLNPGVSLEAPNAGDKIRIPKL